MALGKHHEKLNEISEEQNRYGWYKRVAVIPLEAKITSRTASEKTKPLINFAASIPEKTHFEGMVS